MKQTAVDWLFQELLDRPKDKMVWYYILEKAKEMEKQEYIPITIEQEKKIDNNKKRQMLIGLLDWMNKVAQDNPMVLETDSEDIVDMFLQEYYTK